MKFKRLGLLEDHLLVAESVRMQCESWGFSEFIHYSSAKQLLSELSGGLEFDLLLMDLGMPNTDVEQVFAQIRRKHPAQKVLFLSGTRIVEVVNRLMKMGARGFVTKMAGWEEVGFAIKLVMLDEVYVDSRLYRKDIAINVDPFESLSTREHTVCSLIVEGKTYKEIADTLFIEVNTVGTYMSRIHKKLGTESREEINNLALRYGRFS
ncbi:LuxR C-terminal-related transcriptional regulator [Phaeocystidibacter luteus]|uniref:Response regulator transcription factor n=1 Tax=Phaeocystidibacter luteus TaxID=911197 RepID=A0A6N6RGF2_9FLAO|nr:response regulator transcription factor [Phaeocystidibacter luteus]KAB2807643.1 response regulator transcription factor [Phaeocystidibacter luteus]